MPLRLGSLLQRGSCTASHTTATSILRPFLADAQQCRSASILSSLADNRGAYNKRIRRGRGPSSGKGKTSGRGHKGQKQHGKVPTGFNGGQTPDEVVSGSRGFVNNFSIEMSPINLDRIQSWIDAGRLDPTQPITLKELARSRCLHGVKDGVKLLARNSTALTTPINIIVSRASAAAIEAVEKAGGSVTTRYYTKPAIKRVLQDRTDPINSLQSRLSGLTFSAGTSTSVDSEAASTPEPSTAILGLEAGYKYRLPDPSSRKDIEYYRDPAHRGYLSYQVEQGHGPSLFFKTPGTGKAKLRAASGKQGKAAAKGENRLW